MNGLNFLQLKQTKPDDANYLENAPIRTVVIRNWPTDYFLYVIFERLNSGSLPLSPQELRRALQPGPLFDHLDTFIEGSAKIKHAFGLKAPDRRMRDSEMVLRFIAFDKSYPEYSGDFKEFLDGPVRYFNSNWNARSVELYRLLSRLEVATDIASKVFSPREIFRKWNGARFESRINRALFDCIARYFADGEIEQAAVERKDEIISALKKLCSDNSEFKRSIELTTKTPIAVSTRLSVWGRRLAEILEKRFDDKTFRLT